MGLIGANARLGKKGEERLLGPAGHRPLQGVHLEASHPNNRRRGRKLASSRRGLGAEEGGKHLQIGGGWQRFDAVGLQGAPRTHQGTLCHPATTPGPPVQTDRRQALRPALTGQGIQGCVGCPVGALAGRTQQGGEGGIEDEDIHWVGLAQAMQMPSPPHLGPLHPLPGAGLHPIEGCILQHPGGMHDSPQRQARGCDRFRQLSHDRGLCDVCLEHLDPGTLLPPGEELGLRLGSGGLTANKDQGRHPLRQEPGRSFQAEGAQSP